MQRAHICAGLGIGLMLWASSAVSGQVDLSVENRIGGDSNVLRSENDPERNSDPIEDGTYEISPRLSVRDNGDNLHYRFDYQPTYRSFFKTNGINGFDHVAHGDVTWLPTAIDKFEMTGSHFNSRQIRIEDAGTGAGGNFDVNTRNRIRQSLAHVGYQRSFSPVFSVGAAGDFSDFDFGTKPQNQTDSRAYSGQVFTQYKLSPLTEVGFSVLGRLRENRAVGPTRISSRSDVWNVVGSISRTITPTMSVSIQAGPSIIRQQQFAGGAFDPNTGQRYKRDESSNINVFASASATKAWKTGDANLSYVRSEQRSGAVASGSSISDQVQLNLNHRINDNWVVRDVVLWNRLAQISRQESSNSRFVQIFVRNTATVEWTLSRHFAVIGNYSLIWQQNDANNSAQSTKVTVHLGYLGIRYTFEPLSY
jgi:hypothetical protein